MQNKNVAGAGEVDEFLTAVMRGDSGVDEGDQAKMPTVREKLKAAELLGKRHGMFRENVCVDVDGGVQIINDIPRNHGEETGGSNDY